MSGKRKSPEAMQPAGARRRRASKLGAESHVGPAGAQGPNVGYWQAVGSTRAGAKQSKRP